MGAAYATICVGVDQENGSREGYGGWGLSLLGGGNELVGEVALALACCALFAVCGEGRVRCSGPCPERRVWDMPNALKGAIETLNVLNAPFMTPPLS